MNLQITKIIIPLLIILFPFSNIYSQTPFKVDEGYVVTGDVFEGDTVVHIRIQEIIIFPPRKFKNKRQKRRYSRLVRYVKKVYPYSIIIKDELNNLTMVLDSLESGKERKEYIKVSEKVLRAKFEGQLRKLTFTQGRILLKLIDRETGETTYEIVKQLKGSFSAVFWQSVARLFGSNMKSEYDSSGDDAMIEDIIIRIENGQL